jgi:hypothetical protein
MSTTKTALGANPMTDPPHRFDASCEQGCPGRLLLSLLFRVFAAKRNGNLVAVIL